MRNPIVLAVAVLAATLLSACGSTCGPHNCAGCCDASGTCQTGIHDSACGSQGAACTACSNGRHCQLTSGQCAAGDGGANGSSGGTSSSGTSTTTGTTSSSGSTSTTTTGSSSSSSGSTGSSGSTATSGSTTGSSGTTTTSGTTTSSSGSTSSGPNSVNGDISFPVQDAKGQLAGPFFMFSMSDKPFSCGVFGGSDAGYGANSHVFAGGTMGTVLRTYSFDAGHAFGSLEDATWTTYSNVRYGVAGGITLSSVSLTTASGSFDFMATFRDGGGAVHEHGTFSVPLCH